MIGTVFFVAVFLLALGSMAYQSGLQAQASQAELQAQSTASRRGAEALTFGAGSSGLVALNSGPETTALRYVILRFPNGTVYALASSGEIPSGGTASVKGLLPSGVCTPGAATCLSKYNQIVNGNPPGSSVGVVTSLGNAFWYTYLPVQPLPGAPLAAWVRGDVSTSGTNAYASTTLAVTLAANTTYAFAAYTAIEPTFGVEYYNFQIDPLTGGASLVMACTPMSYPQGGGNQPTRCVTSPGTPIAPPGTLGFGVAPPVFQTPGLFGIVKVGGAGGTFQIDFACTANCGAVTIKAGSYLLVQPVG